MCIFDDNDYEAILGARRPGGGLRNTSDRADDKTDSWMNRTGKNAAWYVDSGGEGDCYSMKARKKNPNLDRGPSDELSSWRTNRACRKK